MFQKIIKLFQTVGMIHFWGDYFDSRFYIAKIISGKRTEYTLDIGCGAGVMLFFANSPNKIGIEIEIESLKQAKKLDQKIELIQADANYLPFKENFCQRISAMHLFPVMKNMNADWKKAIKEIQRISTYDSEILITGANRLSRHFKKTHSIEHREAYLSYYELNDELKNYFKTSIAGYGPYSKYTMYPFKIIFKFSDKILEKLCIERIIFNLLRSQRFLKDGRSYIIQGKKL
jgi:ubiquinone/menaquinone biosynthesis C-methylase UbiE